MKSDMKPDFWAIKDKCEACEGRKKARRAEYKSERADLASRV